MSFGRVTLRHDRSRAKPNTWLLEDSERDIWIRYYEAAGQEWTGRLMLRRYAHRPGALFIYPLDSEMDGWLTESVVIERGRTRVSFMLTHTPATVSAAFMRL